MTTTTSKPTTAPTEVAAPVPGVLERNLAAIARLSPGVARDLPRAAPAQGWTFFRSGDGGLTGETDGRLLASRRAAKGEGDRFAADINIKETAVFVVIGFGAGHHVRAIAEKLRGTGMLIVFEPDTALLKAVLEREDCSSWISKTNFVLTTDPADVPGLCGSVRRYEAMLGLGVKILEHASASWRIGETGKQFLETFSQVASTARTSLVTTMVQTEATIRNVLMNLDYYVGSPGITDLHESALNRPAVVVSAGPSLERNIRELAREGVRERCVIVAVQTALKPLLRAGVRPHFVVALDHHEISRRFYEGLTPADVEGVTLVAEPKANPIILDSFPGAVRCTREEYLDVVLGEELFHDHGSVPAGSTVAHLAYYLARYMGCDPVALIGQDLGFTDGQYYAAGAAIHDVWAGELNPFNTLETLEWQRIVRSRMILHAATDHLGRRIYTDEQMRSYLAMFETDFRNDESKGLTIIDATEGGVRKAHTTRRTLAEFLDEHAPPEAPCLKLPPIPATQLEREAVRTARERVGEVRKGVWRVGDMSRKASGLLQQMIEHHEDQDRVNRLITKAHAIRAEVASDKTAYNLVHRMNQTGTFRRARADREIMLSKDLPEIEQQRKQIERDLQNVRWLAEAADALGELLDATSKALDGGPKRTRDLPGENEEREEDTKAPRRRPRVGAFVSAPLRCGALGVRRTLGPRAWSDGRAVLALTVERIARTPNLECVVVLTDNADEARTLLQGCAARVRVEVQEVGASAWDEKREAIRAGRAFTGWCWRGGVGHLSVYDEALLPSVMRNAMRERALDACLVLGGDWCAVDPEISSALLERHSESPDRFRVTFTQAAPGLAPALIDLHVMSDFAAALEQGDAGAYVSFGGLIGYVPVRPKADPIAFPVCVTTDYAIRDAGARWIADGAEGEACFTQAHRTLGSIADASALELVHAGIGAELPGPGHLIIELTTRRLLSGRHGAFMRGLSDAQDAPEPDRAPFADIDKIESLVRALASRRDDLVVTLGGSGDAALHPDLRTVIGRIRAAGASAVHLRTNLVEESPDVDSISLADVVSIDVVADKKETFAALTGADSLERVFANIEKLTEKRRQKDKEWLGVPWYVARMTRCDAVYDDVESFYNRWLLWLGSAVLDPMPGKAADERIARLPLPRVAAERFARDRMLVLTDGRVVADERDAAGSSSVGNVFEEDPVAVWRRLVETRRAAGDKAREWTMYA